MRSLRLGECIYLDNVVLPQDYGRTWRSIFGNPITDVFADELSGKAEFYLATNQDNQSGASITTAIGPYFRLVVPVGVLLFGSNPAYSYGGSLYSNFDSCYTDVWTGLYVGRYTLDGKFGGAPVNTSFPLRAHSIDSGLGYDHDPGTDSKSLSGRINVDNNHGHALEVWSGRSDNVAGWTSREAVGLGMQPYQSLCHLFTGGYFDELLKK